MGIQTVLINTAFSKSCGIIYPCEYSKSKSNGKSYIIFTNAHTFLSQTITKPKEELGFIIYDDNNEIIPKSALMKVALFIDCLADEYTDIAAILVCIDAKYKITLSSKISFETLAGQTCLRTEGYPDILRSDRVNNKISLDGKLQEIQPAIPYIGVLKISDEFNVYGDMEDQVIFEGLSGAPVFVNRDDGNILLGMNQAVANIGDGKNPFRLIYFLRFEHILKRLRETGCILFESTLQKIRIKWIYNNGKEISADTQIPTDLKSITDEMKNGMKNMLEEYHSRTILVLGGSGAGKSSFIKSFALHADLIDSVGDGQTTRMDVKYEFTIFNPNPEISIKFWGKEDFTNSMTEKVWFDLCGQFFCKHLRLHKRDLKEHPFAYLDDLYIPLKCVASIVQDDKTKLVDFLDKILHIITNRHSVERYKLQEAYVKLIDILNKQNIKCYHYIFNKDVTKALFSEIKKDRGLCISLNSEIGNRLEYSDINQEKYISWLIKHPEVEKYVPADFASSDLSSVDFIKTLLNNEGFFSISEFEFMFGEDEGSLENYFTEKYSDKIIDIVTGFFSNAKKSKNNLEYALEDFYNCVYDKLFEAVKKTVGIKGREKNISYDLLEAEKSEEIKKIIAYCLKVSESKKSLTGLIDLVCIKDSFSNDYAVMFFDIGISKISFIDTCGLDHIERDRIPRRVISDIFTKYKASSGNGYEEIINAVFYVKKLDSGRPTELESILPVIYEVEPKAALYCIFTGVDILKEKVGNNHRAISYLRSPTAKDTLYRGDMFSPARRDTLYTVFERNIATFCAVKFIIENREICRKLFSSVFIDEINCMSIKNDAAIIEILNASNTSGSFAGAINEWLKEFFRIASRTNWHNVHWKTKRANVQRVSGKKDNSLGYWGTYRHRWDLLFIDSYNMNVEKNMNKMLNQLKNMNGDVDLIGFENALIVIRDTFLGTSTSLYMRKYSEKSEGHQFRNLLENMYARKSNIYCFDPFRDEPNENLDEADFLNEVFNFAKINDHPDVFDEFRKLFIKTLINEIENRNKKRFALLLISSPVLQDKIRSLYISIKETFQTSHEEEAEDLKSKLNVISEWSSFLGSWNSPGRKNKES